jgi:hypothetical protein
LPRTWAFWRDFDFFFAAAFAIFAFFFVVRQISASDPQKHDQDDVNLYHIHALSP